MNLNNSTNFLENLVKSNRCARPPISKTISGLRKKIEKKDFLQKDVIQEFISAAGPVIIKPWLGLSFQASFKP